MVKVVHHLGHRAGCDNWPGSNPDGTVTCACGARTWRPQELLKTVQCNSRRRHPGRALLARLRAGWRNL